MSKNKFNYERHKKVKTILAPCEACETKTYHTEVEDSRQGDSFIYWICQACGKESKVSKSKIKLNKIVSFRLPEKEYNKLEKIAARKRIYVGQVARHVVLDYLEKKR